MQATGNPARWTERKLDMNKLYGLILAGALLALGTAPLSAQDFEPEAEADAEIEPRQQMEFGSQGQRGKSGSNWSFSLGFGGDFSPDYDGSDDYQGSPLPIIGVTYRERFYFSTEEGGLGALLFEGDWLSANAFVGYDFGRESGDGSAGGGTTGGTDDNDALIGLSDVDGTVMAGLSLDAFIGFAEASLSYSQGFGGHKGALLDFGLGWPIPLSQDESLGLELSVSGSWASGNYMESYFGVTQAEAIAHNNNAKISSCIRTADDMMVPDTERAMEMDRACPTGSMRMFTGKENLLYEAAEMNPDGYKAKAGIMSYGASAALFWRFAKKWEAGLFVDYARLVGDAADSPLVKIAGTESQLSGGLSISYRFGR